MIKQFNKQDFQQRVQKLLNSNPNERIFSFEYQGQKYWLKQPEHLEGAEKILKARPIKAFHTELQRLIDLSKQNVPIPKLVLSGENFFVLEDAGPSIKNLLEQNKQNPEFIQQILEHCIQALTTLHQRNIVHGRPAIRDMLWQNGTIRFVDFESFSKSKNLTWLKARDGLIFIHSLGRTDFLSDQQIFQVIEAYQQACDPMVWQYTLNWIKKYHGLYRFLYLFKGLARTDLIAIYRLFQQFDAVTKKEQHNN